jgi:Tfp pilus assembly protein PilO
MVRMIIAIVGFVLAGAMFFLYTKPTYDLVKADSSEIAEYDTALDKAAELQQLKQELLSRYNSFDPSELDRLNKFLPDHVDNVRLILDLDNLAGRYGLALQNVDVSGAGATSAKTQTAIGAIGASSAKYDSLTLKFGTRGTYSNFVQFLSDLESSLRVVDLVALTISADTARVAGSGEPMYAYQITLRTYWLK